MEQGTMNIIAKAKLADGYDPLILSAPNSNAYHASAAKKNSMGEWHRKLWQLSPNHLYKLSELNSKNL